MNIKKSILLSLALLLPVVTFLFLKFFGKNEFTVEPLFQTSIQTPAECAGVGYTTPYSISDSILTKLKRTNADSITLVILQNSSVQSQQEQVVQLIRVFKELDQGPLSVVKISTDSIFQKTTLVDKRLFLLQLNDAEFKRVRKCVFLMDTVMDALLIDRKNRIVGQFAITNREDSDRLIVELKILLNKY